MDVDNVIGYEKVLELRKILESVSNKIIPVWHKNRGVEEFKKTCQEYQNKVIAITGFRNEDIQDHQYLIFLKYAKKYNCKVHCLGMTRKKILDKIPFDYADSSSWLQNIVYGKDMNGNKLPKIKNKEDREKQFYHISLSFKPNELDLVNDSLKNIFAFNLRISISSIVMCYLSNMLDIILFEKIKNKIPNKMWVRNNIATIISNCLENYFFTIFAFIGIYDLRTILSIATTTTILEIMIAICDTPFLYLSKKLK